MSWILGQWTDEELLTELKSRGYDYYRLEAIIKVIPNAIISQAISVVKKEVDNDKKEQSTK